MAHFLFSANYSQAGLAGVMKNGAASRIKALEASASSLGGKLEAMYWSFGKYDVILIVELPDNAAAAALSTTVATTGAANIVTTVLLTAEDVDKARSMHPAYQAPGA
jgi:uncharacterized protein with GYD domain